MSQKTPVLIFIIVLTLTGCTTSLRKGEWVSLGPSAYIYEDYDLRITFQVKKQSFAWHFHNKHMQPLTIEQKGIFLAIEGDSQAYSLWGERKESEPDIPNIYIKPRGYVAMTYPVLFRSKLYPFKIKEDTKISLFFNATWGKKSTPYEISFPLTGIKSETS